MKDLVELFRRSLSSGVRRSTTDQASGHAADERDIHLATAALLFEVSRADFDVHDNELLVIRDRLAAAFELDPEDLDELVRLARDESDELLSLHPFVRVINARMAAADKRRILRDLWHVGYADGFLTPRQEATIRHIAELLYVPHSVFLQTKLEVEPTGTARSSRR